MTKNNIGGDKFIPIMELQTADGCRDASVFYKKLEIVSEMESVVAKCVEDNLIKELNDCHTPSLDWFLMMMDWCSWFPHGELFLACVMSYERSSHKLCVTTISSLEPSNLVAAQSYGVENLLNRQLHPLKTIGRKTSKRKICAISK